MAWRPSNVFGPVLIPPWFLHLPLGSALAWQGLPVLLAYASQVFLYFTKPPLVQATEQPSGLESGKDTQSRHLTLITRHLNDSRSEEI
jgi:hypothetical protein